MSPYRAGADHDLPAARGGRTKREEFRLTPAEHAVVGELAEAAGCESRAAWWRGVLRREARLSGWRLDFAESVVDAIDDGDADIGSDEPTDGGWDPVVPDGRVHDTWPPTIPKKTQEEP